MTIVAEQPDMPGDVANMQDVLPRTDEVTGELERLKDRVAQKMITASLDGSLQGAVEALQSPEVLEEPAKPRQDLDDLRLKLADQLTGALKDGSLERALAQNSAQGAAAQESTVEDLRERIAGQLEAALADGSLEAALQICVVPKQDLVCKSTTCAQGPRPCLWCLFDLWNSCYLPANASTELVRP